MWLRQTFVLRWYCMKHLHFLCMKKLCLHPLSPVLSFVFHSFVMFFVTALSNRLFCAILIKNRNSTITLLFKLNAIVWKVISWWLMQYLTQILLIANRHASHFHLPWRTNSLLSANQAKDYVTSQVCVCVCVRLCDRVQICVCACLYCMWSVHMCVCGQDFCVVHRAKTTPLNRHVVCKS